MQAYCLYGSLNFIELVPGSDEGKKLGRGKEFEFWRQFFRLICIFGANGSANQRRSLSIDTGLHVVKHCWSEFHFPLSCSESYQSGLVLWISYNSRRLDF